MKKMTPAKPPTSRAAMIVIVALAALVALALSATTARAVSPDACSPTDKPWTWQAGNWNTNNYIKGTDGCATPWVVMASKNVSLEGWVYYGGSWHSGGLQGCNPGVACNLWSSWAYNGDNFHVEEPDQDIQASGDVYY